MHSRFYKVGPTTLRVEADLPISDNTFTEKIRLFEFEGEHEDPVVIRHHFREVDYAYRESASEVYRHAPWVVLETEHGWAYEEMAYLTDRSQPMKVALCERDYARVDIYHCPEVEQTWRLGNLATVTLFPTDQILLAQLLADRGACLMHAAGVAVNSRGLLFVGHSGTGKSTVATLLKRRLNKSCEVLCDDRIVLSAPKETKERKPFDWTISGTWSHGTVAEVSPSIVGLRAILFLEQSSRDELTTLSGVVDVSSRLLACVVKPLPTIGWWDKIFGTVERAAREVPCYKMEFTSSGAIVSELERMLE